MPGRRASTAEGAPRPRRRFVAASGAACSCRCGPRARIRRAGRQRRAGPSASIQVIPDSSSSATKPAPDSKLSQLDVIVTGEHLDRFELKASMASTARAQTVASGTVEPGTTIGIATPCAGPVRQDDSRDGPVARRSRRADRSSPKAEACATTTADQRLPRAPRPHPPSERAAEAPSRESGTRAQKPALHGSPSPS